MNPDIVKLALERATSLEEARAFLREVGLLGGADAPASPAQPPVIEGAVQAPARTNPLSPTPPQAPASQGATARRLGKVGHKQMAERHGFERSVKRWSDEDVEHLIHEWSLPYAPATRLMEVCRQLHRSPGGVFMRAKSMKLPITQHDRDAVHEWKILQSRRTTNAPDGA